MKKILSFLMVALFSASMWATTWTVAGSNATLFGTTWAPENTANDMELVDGLYTWSKAGAELAAGEIAFKVVKDHAWDEAYPSQDYKLAIEEGGIYTITITFNESSKTVNANATKTGDAVVVPTILMHGNFTGDWLDTDAFEEATDSKTASLTLKDLQVGDYEFGMKIDGTWTANGASFTRDDSIKVISSGSGNCKLNVDKAGDYKFTWTYETNTLVISYPKLAKSALTFAGSDHISLTVRVDGGNLTTGAEVEEKKTVLLTATINDEDYYLNSIRAYKTTDSETEVTITDNSFTMPDYPVTIVVVESKRLLENGFYLNGTHVKWAIADLAPYKFVANSEVEGEYLLENVTLTVGQEIKACYVENDNVADDKWYGNGDGNDNVTIDEEHAGVKTVYFKPAGDEAWGGHLYIAPNTTTAIDNTAVEGKAVKSLENGMLIIEKNGVRYNAQGQIVR